MASQAGAAIVEQQKSTFYGDIGMRVQAPVKGLAIESGGAFGKQFVELLKIAQVRGRQQVEADHTTYPYRSSVLFPGDYERIKYNLGNLTLSTGHHPEARQQAK
jgi:hypothetical protein